LKLTVFSAGAAQELVNTLAEQEQVELEASFGAVGAMQAKLIDGEPCDLIVLTHALVAELGRAGRIVAQADLGVVRTAIAVREADPAPEVASESALREALARADGIYFPDPRKSTAGIHFAKVLERLGIRENLRPFPNGATAMREMVRSKDARVIGCTQVTEITNTPGAKLVAPLPAQFALATLYSAGVCAQAPHPGPAHRFLALLAGDDSRDLRTRLGFDL
jgi:molybdate transport system substrate-binding protein